MAHGKYLRLRDFSARPFRGDFERFDLGRISFVTPPFVKFRLAGINGICPLMEMSVYRQPFVLFPALHCADSPLEVRSDLLPGIQTIVSVSFCRNGDAVDFSFWISWLSGTLLGQVS